MRNRFRTGVVRQAGLAFAATMVPNLFQFVYHFAMSRQLGVGGYGALSSLISLLVVSGIPAGIIATMVAKTAAELNAVGNRGRLRALVRKVIGVVGSIGFLAFAVGAIASPLVAHYLRLNDVAAVIMMAVVLGLNLMVPTVRAVLQGIEDFGAFAASATIEALGKALFGITLVAMGFGLFGAICGIAVASSLSLAYTVFAVLRRTASPEASLNLDLRRLTQSSTGIAASTLCITLLGYVDQPMVKHFFSAPDAGLYGAASLAGKILLYALGFVGLIVLPKVAARNARGESPITILAVAMLAAAMVALPGLLLFAIAPEAVLSLLMGSAYAAAHPLLLSYGAGMSLLGATTILATYNIGAHRFYYIGPLAVAAAVEVAMIQLHHASLEQVVGYVVATNAFAFTGALITSFSPFRTAESLPARAKA